MAFSLYAKFDLTASLQFSGAQRLAILAFGKTTNVAIQGDWPHPGFNGGLCRLRKQSTIGALKNKMVGAVHRARRAVGRQTATVGSLGRTAPPMLSFVKLPNPYQSVTRL